MKDYPKKMLHILNSAFGDVPAYGLFIRHAPKTNYQNIKVKPRTVNNRELVVVEE